MDAFPATIAQNDLVGSYAVLTNQGDTESRPHASARHDGAVERSPVADTVNRRSDVWCVCVRRKRWVLWRAFEAADPGHGHALFDHRQSLAAAALETTKEPS